MITINEKFLNNLPSDKANTTFRLVNAEFLRIFLKLDCETNDYKTIFKHLLDLINFSKYGEINAEINPFALQVENVRDLKKYGSYVKNAIFATKKALFLQYNPQFFIRFDLIYKDMSDEQFNA